MKKALVVTSLVEIVGFPGVVEAEVKYVHCKNYHSINTQVTFDL